LQGRRHLDVGKDIGSDWQLFAVSQFMIKAGSKDRRDLRPPSFKELIRGPGVFFSSDMKDHPGLWADSQFGPGVFERKGQNPNCDRTLARFAAFSFVTCSRFTFGFDLDDFRLEGCSLQYLETKQGCIRRTQKLNSLG